MNDRDTRRLTRAENILIFCQNNAADFSAIPLVAGHLAKITTCVGRVIGARAGQAPNRKRAGVKSRCVAARLGMGREGSVTRAIRRVNEGPVRRTNLENLEAMLVSRDFSEE